MEVRVAISPVGVDHRGDPTRLKRGRGTKSPRGGVGAGPRICIGAGAIFAPWGSMEIRQSNIVGLILLPSGPTMAQEYINFLL
jgi:hypothetical protein